MTHFFRALVPAVLLVFGTEAVAKPAPTHIVKKYTPSSKALQVIRTIDMKKLQVRKYAENIMKKVFENKSLSLRAKIEVFRYIFDRFGFEFVGVLYMERGKSYLETLIWTQTVLSNLANDLNASNNRIDEYVQLSNRSSQDVMTASTAILVATLFNRKAVRPVLEKHLAKRTYQSAQVPAIYLHYLILSITTADLKTDKITKTLISYLRGIKDEESREDIVFALGQNATDPAIMALISYFKGNTNRQQDNVLSTIAHVFYVRAGRQPTQDILNAEFKNTEKKWKKDLLKKLIDNPRYYKLAAMCLDKGTCYKTWDSLQRVVVYDSGLLVSGKNGFEALVDYPYEWAVTR